MDDDATLLRRYVRERSDDAFRTIAQRYLRLIYATSVRHVKDPHLAEDVTQAVLIVLARKAGTIRRSELLPAWLLKATRYASKDALLARSRRQRHERTAAVIRNEIAAGKTLTDPDRIGDAELRSLLDQAMLRLRPRDAALVSLRFVEERDIEEISRAVGMTQAAVRKRIERALSRLRRTLTPNVDAMFAGRIDL